MPHLQKRGIFFAVLWRRQAPQLDVSRQSSYKRKFENKKEKGL
jgi:hypothetical protein